MANIFRYFFPSKDNYDNDFSQNNIKNCSLHNQHVSKICCHEKCISSNSYKVCAYPQCLSNHPITHPMLTYSEFIATIQHIQKQIRIKKNIKKALHTYKLNLFKAISQIMSKVDKQIDEYMAKLNKDFTSKTLNQIEEKIMKLSKKINHSARSVQKQMIFSYGDENQANPYKDEYSLLGDQNQVFQEVYRGFLPKFPMMEPQRHTRKFTAEQIIRNINLSEKQVLKGLDADSFGLGINVFDNASQEQEQRLGNSSSNHLEFPLLPAGSRSLKQQQLLKILPFKCQLNLKFRASENNFLTSALYAIDIRGPIILVAQSHKNKIFGGYSSHMFPKYQEYIEDHHCESFLFSLDEKCILPLKQSHRKYAIRGGKNFWFGRGDLAISDECHKANINWAEIGRAYKAPTSAFGNQSSWLAGAWYFRILDYQIYEVQDMIDENERM